jgi:hypothetical protein
MDQRVESAWVVKQQTGWRMSRTSNDHGQLYRAPQGGLKYFRVSGNRRVRRSSRQQVLGLTRERPDAQLEVLADFYRERGLEAVAEKLLRGREVWLHQYAPERLDWWCYD